ncbi:MAG: tetratricopeptide repeat protein [Balneolaceae bacterium]
MMLRKLLFILILMLLINCEKDSIDERSQNYYQYGINRFNNEKYQESIAYFSRFIVANPDSTDAIIKRGKAYFKLEKFEDAINDFKLAIQQDSLNSEIYYYKSLSFWKSRTNFRSGSLHYIREVTKSIRAISKAIELNNNPTYLLHRAKAQSGLNDHDGAISDLHTLVSINSEYDSLFVAFADSIVEAPASTRQERCRHAINYFDTAVKYHPKDDQLFFKRGQYHLMCDNFEQSISDFSNAITINSEQFEYYLQRAVARKELDDYRNNSDSRNRFLHYNLYYTENYQLAISDLDNAIKLTPENGEAFFYRGRIKIIVGNSTGREDLTRAGQLGYEKAYEVIQNLP